MKNITDVEDSSTRQHWEVVAMGGVEASMTEEQLWRNAEKYFMWCDNNPIITKRTVQSGKEAGKKVEIESPRPYTVKGLCMHCGILEDYLRDVRDSKDKTSLFYLVVQKILYIIHTQNVEYAAVDVFNSIFISKVLNMDKDETPSTNPKVEIINKSISNGSEVPLLAKSENDILEKSDFENAEVEIIKEKNLERET